MLSRLGKLPTRNENGLASIVVVGVLIVLLTLISLGFARIMDRSVRNAVNDETAASATYAAQSGINDLATYIRSHPDVVADGCRDLIGDYNPDTGTGTKGPFYNASNLSGDRNSEYTCLLLDQRPESLSYQNLPAHESKVIKMTTDAVPGSIERVLFSWQYSTNSSDTDRINQGTPRGALTAASDTLHDAASWNDPSSGICRDLNPPHNQEGCVPMLRLTIYPVPSTGSLANLQADSKTVFLYPHQRGVAGTVQSLPWGSITEGAIYHVGCDTGNDAPNFDDLANMDCDLVIDNLASIANINYFYLRIMPIYNNIDLEIKAKNIDNTTVRFHQVQAVVDVTAKVGPASKRLQARIDIGGNSSGGIIPSPNVSPAENAIPDYSIRSANALCKRVLYNDSPFPHVVLENVSASCHWSNIFIDTPVPRIEYYQINDVDHTTENPAGYFGTSFIPMGGTANLEWRSIDATTCTGSGHPAWNGEKAPPPPTGLGSWSGTTFTGSQSIGGLTAVTNFDLECNGPGGTAGSKRVTAWPHPAVTLNVPATHEAGTTFNASWSSQNAVRCVLEGNWLNSSVTDTAGNQNIATSFYDTSPKFFQVTCYDPIGRFAIAGALSGPPGTIGRSDPTSPVSSCDADWNVSDNGNGTGTLTYNGACPRSRTSPGYYRFTDCSPDLNAALRVPCGDVGSSRWLIVGPGTYCGNYWSGEDPWGWVKNSTYKCFTITNPVVVISFFDDRDTGPSSNSVVAWDQAPICNSPGNWWDGTWRCRINGTVPNPNNGATCANGIHRWTLCNASWSATAGPRTGDIRCNAYTVDGVFISNAGSAGNYGPFGWNMGGGAGPNGTFRLECSYPGAPSTHVMRGDGSSYYY